MHKSISLSLILFVLNLFFYRSSFGAEGPVIQNHQDGGALNSRMVMGENSSLLIKGLGGACLAITRLVDSPPCNPAFVHFEKDPRLLATFSLSNGYSNLDKARLLFDKTKNSDPLRPLLSGDQPLDIEMTGAVTFFSPVLNARYTPAHTQLHSLMVGDINPFIQLWVYTAESLSVQWGSSLFLKNLSVGLQVDLVNAKVINREFYLLDLATEAGENYLKPLKLSYVEFKPGLAYTFKNLTFSLLGTRINTPLSEEFNLGSSEVNGGVAYTLWNDIEKGRFDFSLDYKNGYAAYGAKYEIGVLSVVGGLNEFGESYGLFFFIKKMFSGILYSNTNVPWKNNDSVKTVYTQFGIQL